MAKELTERQRGELQKHIGNIRIYLNHGMIHDLKRLTQDHNLILNFSNRTELADAMNWFQNERNVLPNQLCFILDELFLGLKETLRDLFSHIDGFRKGNFIQPDLFQEEAIKLNEAVQASFEMSEKKLLEWMEGTTSSIEFDMGLIESLGYEEDVTNALKHTIWEAITCYDNKCYLASIGMSGKAVETILHNSHIKLVGKDPDLDGKSVDAIRGALKKKGYILEGSVKSIIEFIHIQRCKSVHNSIFHPSQEEAIAVINFVKSMVLRMTPKNLKKSFGRKDEKQDDKRD